MLREQSFDAGVQANVGPCPEDLPKWRALQKAGRSGRQRCPCPKSRKPVPNAVGHALPLTVMPLLVVCCIVSSQAWLVGHYISSVPCHMLACRYRLLPFLLSLLLIVELLQIAKLFTMTRRQAPLNMSSHIDLSASIGLSADSSFSGHSRNCCAIISRVGISCTCQ